MKYINMVTDEDYYNLLYRIELLERQLDEHQKNLEYLSKVTSVKEKEIEQRS